MNDEDRKTDTQTPNPEQPEQKAPENTEGDSKALEALRKELEAARKEIEELRREAAKYRTRAKETAQEAEKAKTLEEQLAEIRKQLEEEAHRRLAAERRAALTGKVADPNAALKLLEDKHLNEDGSVDVDALLKDYPFLAAQPTQPAKPEPTPYPAQGRAPAVVKPKTPEQLAQEKAKDPLYQSL